MLWLIPCQLAMFWLYIYIYPMPAMFWLYTSHASYTLTYYMPASLWLLFIHDMLARLWLYT